MVDSKDLDLFLKDAKIAMLEKRVEELENGTVYTSLISEMGTLRLERDLYREDSIKLNTIRGMLE